MAETRFEFSQLRAILTSSPTTEELQTCVCMAVDIELASGHHTSMFLTAPNTIYSVYSFSWDGQAARQAWGSVQWDKTNGIVNVYDIRHEYYEVRSITNYILFFEN